MHKTKLSRHKNIEDVMTKNSLTIYVDCMSSDKNGQILYVSD